MVYEFIALVGFVWQNLLSDSEMFQPMGYTKSPGLFTDITRFITSFCRGKNILLIMYIDE